MTNYKIVLHSKYVPKVKQRIEQEAKTASRNRNQHHKKQNFTALIKTKVSTHFPGRVPGSTIRLFDLSKQILHICIFILMYIYTKI